MCGNYKGLGGKLCAVLVAEALTAKKDLVTFSPTF